MEEENAEMMGINGHFNDHDDLVIFIYLHQGLSWSITYRRRRKVRRKKRNLDTTNKVLVL